MLKVRLIIKREQVDGLGKNMNFFSKPLKCLEEIGNKVEGYVGTRTSTQARSHAQKVLPHPNSSQTKTQSHNSSSTTMTKGSPPSTKNFALKETRYEISNESDDGISDQIFKVEKVWKPIFGRDRVNSENNVFRFNIGSHEFIEEETSQGRPTNRKLSMNNEISNTKNDLIGSPIQECIKEHFIEEDEEEAKDSLPILNFERHKTFQPKSSSWADEEGSLFPLNKEQEMNLDFSHEYESNEFLMDIDPGVGPWNSIEMFKNWSPYQCQDKMMESQNELNFVLDVDMD